MFDIGWTEILILATISLFVIGPKEIPKFLGYIGKMIAKLKGISRELQDSVDDAIKNSELEDIRKEISFTDPDLSKNLNQIINPSEKHSNIKDNTNQNMNIKNNDKEEVKEKVKEVNKVNISKEDFPSGLKHIRDNNKSSKKET